MRKGISYFLWLRRNATPIYRFSSMLAQQERPSTSVDIAPIKLIPKTLHAHMFGDNIPEEYNEDEEAAKRLLKLEMPKLKSSNSVFEHFRQIANDQFGPYQKLLEAAIEVATNLPEKPSKWEFRTGWTKYNVDGSFEAVEAPSESILFFDVEVCLLDGQLPTLAVALSPTNWYSWCSDRFVNLSEVPIYPRLHHLIPLELAGQNHLPKIVIGHNVAYDRSRVREQYVLEKSAMGFWDTMSMNTAINGMADHQETLYRMKDAENKDVWINQWRRRVCKGALIDVYSKFVDSANSLDKSMQNVFVDTPIELLREDFQRLAAYCCSDVEATCKVFAKLYPMFKERFPSPVTSAGMMIMTNVYLPITANWREFYKLCEFEAASVNDLSTKAVGRMVHELLKDLSVDNKYRHDVWMWASDWNYAPGAFKDHPKWMLNMFSKKALCSKDAEELMHGEVKLRARDVPRLFGLCYGPYPLFYKLDLGWGFLGLPADTSNIEDYASVTMRQAGNVKMPVRQIIEMINTNLSNGFPDVSVPMSSDGNVGPLPFYKLPHPKGMNDNVGTPFVKDFNSLYVDKILRATRFQEELQVFLNTGKNTRFWGNYRDRYHEQIPVWLNDDATRGVIAPSIVPAGTVTRRASHKLWLTSTNPKDGMLGTELKSMVESPEGWKMVGADVDSQEQWLAAIFGDSISETGHVGSTPFSRMQLAGTKSNSTDLHSVVAREVRISRDYAKMLNYARLYGSGQHHAREFLTQQGIPEVEAKEMSAKLFERTKGTKWLCRELSPSLSHHFEHFINRVCPSDLLNQYKRIEGRYFLRIKGGSSICSYFEDWIRHNITSVSEYEIEKMSGNSFLKLVYKDYPLEHTLYDGGYESDTFNFLELNARVPHPKTPVLDCSLTEGLEPLPKEIPGSDDFYSRFKRSIINWLVQSSAVDFLHLLLVCMDWLCKEYDINARFVISIHDEVRYIVTEEDKYRLALALNISNMLVRAAISEKVGIRELPMSIAFFSQVDVDTILRKEVDTPCKMPDGRKVPFGEGLTIEKVLELTNGKLTKSEM